MSVYFVLFFFSCFKVAIFSSQWSCYSHNTCLLFEAIKVVFLKIFCNLYISQHNYKLTNHHELRILFKYLKIVGVYFILESKELPATTSLATTSSEECIVCYYYYCNNTIVNTYRLDTF